MEQWAILKTLSGSSPIFALSIHTTFSQTQTGATVPLRRKNDYMQVHRSTSSTGGGLPGNKTEKSPL
jgi:hypothetical protein